jgi:hypothetical protein
MKNRKTTRQSFDNEALDPVELHAKNYWQRCLLRQLKTLKEGREHSDRWVVADHDLSFAACQLALLLFGPDDGSTNRGDIERQMQNVMEMSFYWTGAERASW